MQWVNWYVFDLYRCRYNSLYFSIFTMLNTLVYMQAALWRKKKICWMLQLWLSEPGDSVHIEGKGEEKFGWNHGSYVVHYLVSTNYLLVELNREDRQGYTNFLHVTNDLFNALLARVGPHIQKDTFWRKYPDLGIRISISMRYMATGDSYKSLQYGFRVAHNTISKIIPETGDAITLEMCDEGIQCPSTPEEWKEAA